MADMTGRVRKGGVYSFSLTSGEAIEGTAQEHGIAGSPIRLHVSDQDGNVYVNPDHVTHMRVVDESAAEQRRLDYY